MARSTTAGRPLLRLHVASVVAAQLFDYGTFSMMVGRHGIGAELNPIVAQGFEAFGLPFLAVSKLVLMALVGSIVVVIASRSADRPALPALATAVSVVAVVAGLVGGISNTAAG